MGGQYITEKYLRDLISDCRFGIKLQDGLCNYMNSIIGNISVYYEKFGYDIFRFRKYFYDIKSFTNNSNNSVDLKDDPKIKVCIELIIRNSMILLDHRRHTILTLDDITKSIALIFNDKFISLNNDNSQNIKNIKNSKKESDYGSESGNKNRSESDEIINKNIKILQKNDKFDKWYITNKINIIYFLS